MHAHTHKVHFSFYKTFIHTKFVQSEKKQYLKTSQKERQVKKTLWKKRTWNEFVLFLVQSESCGDKKN